MNRRAIFVLALLIALACFALAKGSAPIVITFDPVIGDGINDDGKGSYTYANHVSAYLGNDGASIVLVTYSSGRTLHFTFDPADPVWQASGLPQDFNAEVDIYANNWYGSFLSMGITSGAQVDTSLMFHWNRSTYELHYRTLAVERTGQNEWLVTSQQSDLTYGYGFTPDNTPTLSVARRRANTTFGQTQPMPIHFTFSIQ